MTLPSSDNLIGKQIRDSYGRYSGTIVGINTDESGSICSIGVDAGYNGFQTISVDQVTFVDDDPVLVSNWKFKAENLIRTSSAAQKRIQALEDLHKEGEISEAVYEQLISRNKAQFDICVKNCDDAVSSLNEKADVLQNEKNVISAFFGVLKLQHRIGEIDDSIYQSTSEHLEAILQRNDKEAKDISAILDSLTLQEPEPAPSTPAVTPVSEETTETNTCEQASEAPVPEIITANADAVQTTVEEVVSVDASAQSSEAVDNTSVDDTSSLSYETPVETPSLNEVPENSTEQTLEVPAEPASNETTDVSDHMPLDDSVQTEEKLESNQTVSGDITDSVSFENTDAKPADITVSEKVNKTPSDSDNSSDDNVVCPTQ